MKSLSSDSDLWLLLFLALHGLIMTGSGQWLCLESLGERRALHLCHFFGLWPLRTLRDLELDLLTLF